MISWERLRCISFSWSLVNLFKIFVFFFLFLSILTINWTNLFIFNQCSRFCSCAAVAKHFPRPCSNQHIDAEQLCRLVLPLFKGGLKGVVGAEALEQGGGKVAQRAARAAWNIYELRPSPGQLLWPSTDGNQCWPTWGWGKKKTDLEMGSGNWRRQTRATSKPSPFFPPTTSESQVKKLIFPASH